MLAIVFARFVTLNQSLDPGLTYYCVVASCIVARHGQASAARLLFAWLFYQHASHISAGNARRLSLSIHVPGIDIVVCTTCDGVIKDITTA